MKKTTATAKQRVKTMLSWIQEATGSSAKGAALWSALSLVFSLAIIAINLSLGILLIGSLVIAVHAGLAYGVYRASRARASLSPRQFFIIKKAVNYFAFIQFCFHSIALVLAWSNARLGDGGYYLAYLGNLLVTGSYLPVFCTLNSKPNQVRRGIMQLMSKNGRKKYRPVSVYRGFLPGLLSWVDALVWASAVVIFINSLVFQLYQIPSESMVPELYVGSRVFTVKTLTNPEIPLSLVRIPVTAGINRFDQYVISNPRYDFQKEAALTDFWHNFLYMISFTLIKNPRLDEHGYEIADPLIKRLIGLPGEQLLMADDVLYVRGSDTGNFRRLEGEENHAYTFSNNLPANLARVQAPTINPQVRRAMLAWDEEKNAVQEGYSQASSGLLDFFEALPRRFAAAGVGEQAIQGLPRAAADFRLSTATAFNEQLLAGYLRRALLDSDGFIRDLENFLTAWRGGLGPANIWEETALNSNLLFKLKFATSLRLYADATLSHSGQPWQDSLRELSAYSQTYIQHYFDWRNFPPFPAQGVLDADHYFLLGDNRYNSIDLRHWDPYAYRNKALYPKDEYSLVYSSMLAPFALTKDRIRGKALFSLF